MFEREDYKNKLLRVKAWVQRLSRHIWMSRFIPLTWYHIVLLLCMYRMPRQMWLSLLGYITQEAMPFLLQLLLPEVPMCSIWHVRQQGRVSMLQQQEEQGWRSQVPLKSRHKKRALEIVRMFRSSCTTWHDDWERWISIAILIRSSLILEVCSFFQSEITGT
jgi:hypothetical protein